MRRALAREAVRHHIKTDPGAPRQSQSRPVLGHDGDGRLTVAWNGPGRDTEVPISPVLANALTAAQTLVDSPEAQFRIKLKPGPPPPPPRAFLCHLPMGMYNAACCAESVFV